MPSVEPGALKATTKTFPRAKLTLLHCFEFTSSSMSRSISGIVGGRQLAEGAYKDFIGDDLSSAAPLASLPIFMERGSIDCIIHAYAADKPPFRSAVA